MRHSWIAFLLLLSAAAAVAQSAAGRPVAAMPLVSHWQTFADPNEGAFQVDVPAGWKNSGGTNRWNALQYRSWVAAVSPDGATILAIGDSDQLSYATPMYAFPPGSIYDGGGGTRYIVAPIQSAQQYAVTWGTRKLAALCTGVKMTGSHERNDLAGQLGGSAASMGMAHDFGDAAFTCQGNGVELSAYVLLGVTVLRTTALTALWYPDSIIAFVAPSPIAGVAAGMLAHMVQSYKPSLEWLARQSQTAVAVSHIATETNAAISSSIMKGWQDRGAIIDQVMAEGSRERLGIDVYSNPATGTQYTVANSHNYYWVNAGGTVVGTDTDTAPSASFSRLTRVPPR